MRHIAFMESNTTGTGFQALLIAKDLGLRVTFLSRDINKYLKVSGADEIFRNYVDEIIECETNDAESVLAAISSEGRKPSFDAFMTIGEYHVPIAAEVARHLGVPGVNPQAARVARNKLWTKEWCQRAGIPLPQFACATTVEEAMRVVQDIGLPCVLKPVDEAGSVDVALCTTLAEVEEHFWKIKNNPLNFQGQRRYPYILIEEYLLGYEVSIETFTNNGQTTVIGVTDKHLASTPYFVEIGHTFPSCLPPGVITACEAVAIRALEAIDFNLGASHIEIKVTNEGPKLIEINGRAAGDHIPDLIELSLGIPLLQEIIRLHLGDTPQLEVRKRKGAAIRYLTSSPGLIQEIWGQEVAKRLPGIVEVFINTRAGREVKPLRCSLDRLGYAIAVAETSYMAGRLAETAISQIMVKK